MSRRAQSTLRLGMAALSLAVAAFTAGCPGTNLGLSEDGTLKINRSPSPGPTKTPSPQPTATASGSADPTPTPAATASPTPTPTPTPANGTGGLDVRTVDMAPNSWAPHTPMTLARQGLVAVDGGDRLFVLTGDGSMTDETFTYSTGQWQRYYSSVAGLQTNLYFAGAAMLDSTIALIGGMSGDEWGANYYGLALSTRDNAQAPKNPDFPSALLALNDPVYSMGVAALNGKVYVAGGRDASSVKSACYVFNTLKDPSELDSRIRPLTQANTAQPIASLKAPRAGLGLVALNGRLYAVGGYMLKSAAADLPDADTLMQVYDPSTDTWLASGNGGPRAMPTERYGFAVAALNGKIYVVGGKNEAGATLRTVEAYDPVSDTWTTLAPMPTARSVLALVAHKGRLYALGGADAAGRATRVVEVYAP